MRKTALVGAALALALSVAPTVAMADDVNPLQGFGDGFETLVNPDTSVGLESAPERDYIDSYEPMLVEGETIDVVESTPMDGIMQVNNAVNTVYWSGNSNLLGTVRKFLMNAIMSNALIVPAVALVFMYWGLRKSVRTLFAAFRKGRASV